MKLYKQTLLTVAALAAIPSSAMSATIIDVNFETGLDNLASRGSNAQTIGNSLGTGNPASKGVNSNNHGALVHTTTRAIDSEISFSVDARWASNTPFLNRQALLVGWTKNTGSFNTFNQAGQTAIGLKTTTVDNTTGDVVSFAFGGATDISQATTLGAMTATMVDGNWYRFSGTISYDGTATVGKEFTFTNLVLAKIGSDGTGTPTTLISGSFTDGYARGSGWQTADTLTSSLVLISGSQGGVSNIDNFSVTVIPEPSTTALLGLGGLALILRRRK